MVSRNQIGSIKDTESAKNVFAREIFSFFFWFFLSGLTCMDLFNFYFTNEIREYEIIQNILDEYNARYDRMITEEHSQIN